MRSRMNRYENKPQSNRNVSSRTQKNQELYDHLYTNSKYTEFRDDDSQVNMDAIDLSSVSKNYHTREDYQRMKEYHSVLPTPKVKRELEQFQFLYPEEENKIYDINSILEEAKKNREDGDQLEKKRKLRNTQYNILANLDLDKLEQYKKEKKEREKTEEEELQDLINTITSRKLRDDIDENNEKDLMSALLPSDASETIITESISKEILDKEDSKKNKELENMDKSFYTKSMDLSDQDFEVDDEFKDIGSSGVAKFVKVLLIIILIAIVATIIYFVIKQI